MQINSVPAATGREAVRDIDGNVLGAVGFKGKSFYGSRKRGTQVDMRMYCRGFRTQTAAVKWVLAGGGR